MRVCLGCFSCEPFTHEPALFVILQLWMKTSQCANDKSCQETSRLLAKDERTLEFCQIVWAQNLDFHRKRNRVSSVLIFVTDQALTSSSALQSSRRGTVKDNSEPPPMCKSLNVLQIEQISRRTGCFKIRWDLWRQSLRSGCTLFASVRTLVRRFAEFLTFELPWEQILCFHIEDLNHGDVVWANKS